MDDDNYQVGLFDDFKLRERPSRDIIGTYFGGKWRNKDPIKTAMKKHVDTYVHPLHTAIECKERQQKKQGARAARDVIVQFCAILRTHDLPNQESRLAQRVVGGEREGPPRSEMLWPVQGVIVTINGRSLTFEWSRLPSYVRKAIDGILYTQVHEGGMDFNARDEGKRGANAFYQEPQIEVSASKCFRNDTMTRAYKEFYRRANARNPIDAYAEIDRNTNKRKIASGLQSGRVNKRLTRKIRESRRMLSKVIDGETTAKGHKYKQVCVNDMFPDPGTRVKTKSSRLPDPAHPEKERKLQNGYKLKGRWIDKTSSVTKQLVADAIKDFNTLEYPDMDDFRLFAADPDDSLIGFDARLDPSLDLDALVARNSTMENLFDGINESFLAGAKVIPRGSKSKAVVEDDKRGRRRRRTKK